MIELVHDETNRKQTTLEEYFMQLIGGVQID